MNKKDKVSHDEEEKLSSQNLEENVIKDDSCDCTEDKKELCNKDSDNNKEDMKKEEKSDEIHVPNHKESHGNNVEVHVEEVPKSGFAKIWGYLQVVIALALIVIVGFAAYKHFTKSPIAVKDIPEAVTFEIDGKSFTIPKDQDFITVDVKPGKHTVTMKGQEIGTFDRGWFDSEAIINPLKISFVEESILYGPEKYANKLPNNKITIEGETIEGPYKLIEPAVYIKKTWDYSPFEKSPDTVRIRGKYTIKKELFYLEDFIRYINE